MKHYFTITSGIVILLLTCVNPFSELYAQPAARVKGIVFYDRNGNGIYDTSDTSGDKPLKGIAVSNGRDVVLTDRKGVYELSITEYPAIFVIKPRNWAVPVDDNQMPRFYYMHSPKGLSGSKFKGLSPTGELPEQINFPLYKSKEKNAFNVLVFGDTQPRDDREIYYMARDVIPELKNVDAEFGITLGDITFDNLNLFDHIIQTHSTIGVPWRYVAGNHDNDYSGNNTYEARGSWYRTFGPSYYSFSYGPAHFIVLDNVRWIVKDNKRYYRTGLGEDQMEFVRKEINRMESDQLLFLLCHIPFEGSTAWEDENEKKTFYQLIASHPNTITLAAHTHKHYHHFIGKEEGYPGEKPHHMISMGTVCGAWWAGVPDEYGIPHAMMSDGTPNSYGFLQIDKNDWKLKWKAAGKPADFQMHIDAPDYISSDSQGKMKVTANIFNALPSATVKMKIGNNGEWITMQRTLQDDPSRLAAMEWEKKLGDVPWRPLGAIRISEHIWTAETDVDLSPGVYVIHINAVDRWWQYEGSKLMHVK